MGVWELGADIYKWGKTMSLREKQNAPLESAYLLSLGRVTVKRSHPRRSAIELGVRLVNWISRSRKGDEDGQSASLLPWQEQPVGSQGVPAGVVCVCVGGVFG